MPTEYSLENNLSRLVEELIADTTLDAGTGRDLGALREQEIRVTPVMSTRESGEGEITKTKGRPVTVRKVSDLEKTLAPNIGDFLLIVDAGTFDGANDHQQKAMLYDALLLIDITTGKDGSIKMGKRQPDLILNSETIRVFGLCDSVTLTIADSVKHAKKHAHLLMPPEEEAPEPASKDSKKKKPASKPKSEAAESVDDGEVDAEEEPIEAGEPEVDDIEPEEDDNEIEDGDKPVKRRRA